MSFLHPAILIAGLLATAIPIIIHFIRRRRRPIEWAAMRFLQDAVRKRRRRLRLEQLLLLLTRCAIVALLAFAVARPTAGRNASTLPTAHIIAVDNSIGSGTLVDGSNELALSIKEALAIIEDAESTAGDSVAVVALGAPGRAVLWPPTPDMGAARRALERIEATDSRPTLEPLRSSLTEGLAADVSSDQRTVLHLISSWRSSGMHGTLRAESDARQMPAVNEVVIHSHEGNSTRRINTGIAGMEASTPSVVGAATLAPQTRVSGTLVRSTADRGALGPDEVSIELVAQPSGTIAGRATARFDAGQNSVNWPATIDEPALTPGRGGRIAIQAVLLEEDANPHDNRAGVVITRKRELRAAVVERTPIGIGRDISAGTWTLAALSPDDRAGVTSFRVDPASLGSIPAGSVDAMFILEPARVTGGGWARAAELLARGGLVVITPDRDTGSGTNTSAWADQLNSLSEGQITITQDAGIMERAERLARTPPSGLLASLRGEFADLIASVGVTRRLKLGLGPGAVALIETEPNDAADPFVAQTFARGTLIVLAAPLDIAWTDLPARPVFVPIVQELVRRGSGLGIDAAAQAGPDPSALAPATGIDRWERDPDMSPTDSDRGENTRGALAGVWLGLGSDGQVVRTLTLRPDAEAARLINTDPGQRREAVQSIFDGASIRQDSQRSTTHAGQTATGWGDRVAFVLLAVGTVLALLEAFVARTASHPTEART